MSGIRVQGEVVTVCGGRGLFALPIRTAFVLILIALATWCFIDGNWLVALVFLSLAVTPLLSLSTCVDMQRRVVDRTTAIAGREFKHTQQHFPSDARVMIRRTIEGSRTTSFAVLLVWSGGEIEVFQSSHACSAIDFMRVLRKAGGFKVQPRVKR